MTKHKRFSSEISTQRLREAIQRYFHVATATKILNTEEQNTTTLRHTGISVCSKISPHRNIAKKFTDIKQKFALQFTCQLQSSTKCTEIVRVTVN